jgi:hypothetical protein
MQTIYLRIYLIGIGLIIIQSIQINKNKYKNV